MADIFDIAGRINSTSQERVVTTADQIKDETQNKKQNAINADVARHETEIHGTGGIDSRLSDVEQMEQIVIDGGEAQIATGSDFTNPDAAKRAKMPTVGAIVDGLNDGVYDVSKRNPTAGPNSDGKFTLEYILDQNNVNTLIPTGWRHGGMTISFVDSSDNKYVRYNLLTDEFSTTESDWQGVDVSPQAESKNLVESGGIRLTLNNELPFVVMSEYAGQAYSFYPINIKQGHTYRFQKTNRYSASGTNIYCRVTKSNEGQSNVIIVPSVTSSASYTDFIADKDYNYIVFYNSTTTTGGTQEVFVFDLEFFNKNIFIPLNTETTFSTNEKVKNVGIDSGITKSSNALSKSGQVYLGLINLSKRNSLFSVSGKILKTDGDTQDTSGFFVTPFIPVSEGEAVTVAGYSGGETYSYSLICFYTEPNKSTFISADGNDGTAGFRTRTVTVPVGAKYMRCGSRAEIYDESYVDCAFLSHLINQLQAQEKQVTSLVQQTNTLDVEISELIGASISFTASCVPATAVKVPFTMRKGTTITVKATVPAGYSISNARVFLRYYEGTSAYQYQVELTFRGDTATYICDKDYDAIYVYDTDNEQVSFEASYEGKVPILEEEINDVLSAGTPSIIITNGNSNTFDVKVFSDSKKEYLTHQYMRLYDERDMEYGDGQTKHLVTCNCWTPILIADKDGHPLAQGNCDFINSIESSGGGDFAGEGYYVGERHGCAISVYTKFFADGEEIDPTTLGSSEIKCNTFRLVEKVNYYASNASLAANSRSYPKLDANGDMILANVHFAEHTIERNNVITTWNRLTVKRDHTKFGSLFAGMNRVFLPYFSHLVLNDPNNSANGFTHDGTDWTFTDEGGSGIVLVNGTDQFLKGSNVIFYGDEYYYSQTIEQMSRPWSKLNFRNTVYNDDVKSIKVYQLPAICTSSASVLGETAEEFMNGDVIECKLVTRIGCNIPSE